MKRLWCGLLLSLLTLLAHAQTAQPQRDGLIWNAGQLQLLQGGVARPVTREVRLPSGTRVLPSGHVILANGRQGTFLAGDGVDPRTGAWFARRAHNANGTTFLPLPVRVELPASALGPLGSRGSATSARPSRYEQRRQRDENDRRLPDKEDDEDDDE